MEITTKAFGVIKINEEDILNFIGPILGFEDIKQYVVLHDQNNPGPFFWLQAVNSPEPAFVVVEPGTILADYHPVFPPEELELLEIDDQADLRILLIVRIPENIKDISVNLKAPVLINARKGLAKQVVLEDKRYSVRHYLLPAAQGGETRVGTESESR
ncbi:flagellar assembly factor FliW [Carboxydocella sporoproducens DSM 16521]|uniref:Flagellar assembly factor FliW n=2 Tax=Carboxydocella TaxID=178898 RepID=A0A1T4QWE8_9FIRM|nr:MULTISPECIES: flagellar assembly protein FliW [Carboxydocella]AVX21689.1 flagellar assembly factor FliW [Carboxydocella thermautotrophica]SKA08092.1 flagellar assembly factor FliW [Carboxydocella sporoproducens DSM 16521]